uniref:Uncharacterized protein n=1 Tax=Ananas comosus var. bracteatus TaxID=296719 RepID=A0A6V7Q363_ANACO|nr:unnamed protein product [Ananas comosus var. bracteatus]
MYGESQLSHDLDDKASETSLTSPACESLIELDRDTLAYSVGSRPRVAAPEFGFVLSPLYWLCSCMITGMNTAIVSYTGKISLYTTDLSACPGKRLIRGESIRDPLR